MCQPFLGGEKGFLHKDNRNNMVTKMAHEMGHFYDVYHNGRANVDVVFQHMDFKMKEPDAIVTQSEFHAMYFENIARNHYGFGLRTKYDHLLPALNLKINFSIKENTFLFIHPDRKKPKTITNNYKAPTSK